jgi:hypothetical protein
MSADRRDLVGFVASLVSPLVQAGRATLSTHEVGEHFEAAITPTASGACPVTVVGAVPGDLTLSIGRPALEVDVWTGDDEEGRQALAAYLDAIFGGRVREVAWLKNGRVTKGSMTFDLASGRTVKHRYSNRPFRAGHRVETAFDPY